MNSEGRIANDITREESVKKPQTFMEMHQEKLKEEKKKKQHRKSSSDSDDEEKKHEKLKKALHAEEALFM